MKHESRRSVVISILIALVVHLLILLALFLSMYRQYTREMHACEEITVLTHAGQTGTTAITLYQPSIQSSISDPMVDSLLEPEAPVHSTISDMLTLQEELQPQAVATSSPDMMQSESVPIKVLHAETVGDIQEIERVLQTDKAKPKKQLRSCKQRRKDAIQKLKQLSFAQPSHDTTPVALQGDRGFVDHTNVHDIVYQRYVRKIIHMMAAAVNAEKLRVMIDESLSCVTTLWVKIQRDGRMIDFHFESAHPTLRQLEQAAQPVVQASWLYLPIPDSIAKDCIVIPLHVRVECRRGFDMYHFYFNE